MDAYMVKPLSLISHSECSDAPELKPVERPSAEVKPTRKRKSRSITVEAFSQVAGEVAQGYTDQTVEEIRSLEDTMVMELKSINKIGRIVRRRLEMMERRMESMERKLESMERKLESNSVRSSRACRSGSHCPRC